MKESVSIYRKGYWLIIEPSIWYDKHYHAYIYRGIVATGNPVWDNISTYYDELYSMAINNFNRYVNNDPLVDTLEESYYMGFD